MKKKIFIKNSLILLFALFSTMVFAKKSNKIEPILIKSPGSFRFDLPESDKKMVNFHVMMKDCFKTSEQFKKSKINNKKVLEIINKKILESDKTPVISCKELITAYKKK